jgi:hypothetical protein
MKQVIFLLLITAIFGGSVLAQNSKTNSKALPAGIAEWTSEDSDRILNDAGIKARLKKLLGKKNYPAFMESFETLTTIEKNGSILFSSGCLIHACTHVESAIAIDLANNTIHAAIFRDDKKTGYFNERGSKTPRIISNWADRLSSLNGGKD